MFGVDDLRVLPRNYVECPLKNAFLINRREAQLHIRTYFPQCRAFLVWRTRRTEVDEWRCAATAAGRLKIVLY